MFLVLFKYVVSFSNIHWLVVDKADLSLPKANSFMLSAPTPHMHTQKKPIYFTRTRMGESLNANRWNVVCVGYARVWFAMAKLTSCILFTFGTPSKRGFWWNMGFNEKKLIPSINAIRHETLNIHLILLL